MATGHTPVRPVAVKRRSIIHDEEPDTKNIVLDHGDENIGEKSNGLDLDEGRAWKEGEDIECRSISGRNLHHVYNDERLKLAANQ